MQKTMFDRLPLNEFDSDRTALIDPSAIKNIGLPECCVIPFYGSLINELKQRGRLEKIHELASILTPIEIYKLEFENKTVTIAYPLGCGAPLAGAILEELIALGCRKFVACGSAGCLKPGLKSESIIIPNAAVRDEGTSYHYLPPSRTVVAEPGVIQKLENVLKEHQIKYEVGLTWTTDAPYRETRAKIARRKAEGCLTVEMEFAALLAIARFRKVPLGQYLLAGDDVSGEERDHRGWSNKSQAHERLFWLAVEALLSL